MNARWTALDHSIGVGRPAGIPALERGPKSTSGVSHGA